MPSTTRRALVSTAALGAAVTAVGIASASPARAGEHRERELRAVDKRRLHRERLSRGSQDFGEYSPLSYDGINTALDRLVEEDVINRNDRGVLGTIVFHLFNTEIEDVRTLLGRVEETITSTPRRCG